MPQVLEYLPSVELPFEWLVQLVPPLKKRSFSISSSPLAHPNQVHLTVSVVSTITPFKRKRYGLCSSWLAGLDPNKKGGIFVVRNVISLKDLYCTLESLGTLLMRNIGKWVGCMYYDMGS